MSLEIKEMQYTNFTNDMYGIFSKYQNKGLTYVETLGLLDVFHRLYLNDVFNVAKGIDHDLK